MTMNTIVVIALMVHTGVCLVGDTINGSKALLDEAGYTAVAALHSDEHMEAYILRVLEADGKHVLAKHLLAGFVPWYSGTMATQSLARMREELSTAWWVMNKSIAQERVSFNAESRKWMSLGELVDTFGENRLLQMSEHGMVEMRTNPLDKNLTEYAARDPDAQHITTIADSTSVETWMDQEAIATLYSGDDIRNMTLNGLIKSRLKPNNKSVVEYFVVERPSDAKGQASKATVKQQGRTDPTRGNPQVRVPSWMTRKDLAANFSRDELVNMTAHGLIEPRRNPGNAEKTQYLVHQASIVAKPMTEVETATPTINQASSARWWSQEDLAANFTRDELLKMTARGLLEPRRDPDDPKNTQYLIRETHAAPADQQAPTAPLTTLQVNEDLVENFTKYGVKKITASRPAPNTYDPRSVSTPQSPPTVGDHIAHPMAALEAEASSWLEHQDIMDRFSIQEILSMNRQGLIEARSSPEDEAKLQYRILHKVTGVN